MHKLGLLAVPFLAFATPGFAADLGPYPERESYYERPAPPVVERERIIERHYYEPAPVYERRVYVAPPPVNAYAYYGRPYAYAGWRPRHFFPRSYWRYRDRGW